MTIHVAISKFLFFLTIVCALLQPCIACHAMDWLSYVNYYRATALLPPVTDNATWSYGDQLHARYMVKNNVIAHDEDPGMPWYTPEGDAAAGSSNVMVSSSAAASDEYAIDLWMQGPFHAVGILDPGLSQVGYGSYREADGGYQMGAALNVLDGLGSIPPSVAFPVLWPGSGQTVPIRSYGGYEAPDPLTSCPGYSAPTGLPLIVQVSTGYHTLQVTASSFRQGATVLDHCIFSGATYTNPNSSYQSLGRSVLNARDAVVIIPRAPLTAGLTYTVSLTVNGQTYTWSFSVSNGVPCAYSMSPSSAPYDAPGGSGSVNVTAPSGCSWTAQSNASWIIITAGSSGNGNGTVSYTVGENGGVSGRTGTVTVAGKNFTVTQNGALVADFTAAPITGPTPLYVRFSDLSVNGPTSWAWTFGDGITGTERNPGHTYRAAGTYTVTLTAAKPGDSDAKTVTNYIVVSSCSYERVCVNNCCRSSLQSAYNQCLPQGSTIEAQAQEFTENLTLSQSAPVILKGGHACDYGTVVSETVLKGVLTIAGGSLTVKGLLIR